MHAPIVKEFNMRFLLLVSFLGCLIAMHASRMCAQIDCDPNIPHDLQLQMAGAVFFGRLVDIRLAEEIKGADRYEMTFRLDETWKGPKVAILKVVGYSSFSLCTKSYPFKPQDLQIGAKYLVYARAPFDIPGLPNRWGSLSKNYSVGSDGDLFRSPR
jgi:hypothetical protein